MQPSPEEQIAEGILATVVELLAMGHSGEKVRSLVASTLPPEIDPRPAVERVSKWQRCFIDYMKHGWLDSPVPPDIMITVDQYFNGSMDEMNIALRYLPLWIEASHAREIVAEFTQVLIKKGVSPALEREAEEKLGSLPEPGASIAIAIWKSPNQVAIRDQYRLRPGAGTGCASILLLAGVGIILGCLALVGMGWHMSLGRAKQYVSNEMMNQPTGGSLVGMDGLLYGR